MKKGILVSVLALHINLFCMDANSRLNALRAYVIQEQTCYQRDGIQACLGSIDTLVTKQVELHALNDDVTLSHEDVQAVDAMYNELIHVLEAARRVFVAQLPRPKAYTHNRTQSSRF